MEVRSPKFLSMCYTSFLGTLLFHRGFITGSVSAAASWDHHVEATGSWPILCLWLWYLSWRTCWWMHPSFCQCSVLAQEAFQVLCPGFVFKHQICPLDSIPVQQCQDILFRLFFCYFDLFVLPHTVLLSPQLPAPMAMVQHFSPHSCIKCSISPAKPVLVKACSPCPLINIYVLWNSMGKLVYSWQILSPPKCYFEWSGGKDRQRRQG